jgi:hypothetical protein
LGHRLKIMPITINGSGTVTGISAGGLPDDCIVTADIADNNVTTAKIDNISVTEIKIADANVTAAKLSGAQTGSAPIYGCRAWVNFDGTRNEADTGASTNGANVKIRASGNVSSVLKNAQGDYTVTFTTAMVDANYAAVAMGFAAAGTYGYSWSTNAYITAPAAGSIRISNSYQDDNSNLMALRDSSQMFLTIFR